jgi:hypothetical protein
MSLGQPLHPDCPDYIQSTEYSGNCLLEIHSQTRCEAAFAKILFVAPISPMKRGLKARRSFSPWKMRSMSTNGRSRSGLPKPANAPHSGFRVPPCPASGQVAGFKPRHRAAQPLDQPPDLPRTDRRAWLWSASHDDPRCLAWANASGFATRIGAPSAKATNASRVSV